ncbi:EAL domain-containing protein [Sphingomonas sp.]|uniref:EAL domain-containing protein n=1 Tax=Sphingomonas sp. TaxID=28214 RepID=UPI002C0A6743|nr:EAL domain-containing protein [Sphingomonas sp.]HTG38207.1 EAL domain-containing protein [Sphingomonas sp.]
MSLGIPSFDRDPPLAAPAPVRDLIAQGALAAWRLMLGVEICNFALLRRSLGRPRADLLIDDVANEVRRTLPGAHVVAVGRTAIEIGFDGALPSDANEAIDRITARFASPLDIDGEPYAIEFVVAGAAIPSHECDEVRFAEGLEAALAEARSAQKTVVHDLSRADSGYDRTSLMRDLSAAIGNGEIFLQYQPKVHLRRQEIVSIEALVRWHHPQRGLIFPGDFIPLAESSGKIGALTIWTIQQAILDQQLLAMSGHDIPIFVNISGVLLADADFVDAVCVMKRETSAKIGFEITETAVIRDPDSAIRHLRMFDDIGITLAIDDYGAGLSSLAYLKQLPARELKIDKMFVLELTSSNRDPLIVRSTIDLAHALDMEVTAEGVETPAALALLGVMGCDVAQGFLISRPIAFPALKQFLDEDRHLSATAVTRPSFGRPESFWKRA